MNLTGNALLGQIVADSRKPLKWTRDRSLFPLRVRESYNTEGGLYAQGSSDFLIVPMIDSWTDRNVGWKLIVNPGTYSETWVTFGYQKDAKEEANLRNKR